MPHTPTLKNLRTNTLLGKLIAAGLLVQVLVPSLALAFTPMSQGNQACIQGSNQCAPTMAACNTERATITGTPPPCVDYSVPGPGSLVSQAISKGLDWVGGGLLDLLGSGLALIAKLVFELAGKFLDAMGYVLDFSIGRTIDSATYSDLQAVNKGWTAVRDFSNLFFIFALLYIAIKTILGMGGGSTKRWVAHLIIAALLINFSLFATKVVIDAGNVLAMGFWEKITVQQGPNQVSSATANFQQGFRINTNFDAANIGPWQRLTIYLGGAFVMMVAGYVFMVGAMMMIVRTVTLLFLMIASPFAFLGFALPVGGSWANSWLTKLLGSTFVAPAFLAMLYIDSIIINSLDMTKLTGNGATSGFAAAFLGRSDNYGIFYQFFLMIFLLLAALKVADAVSSGASSAAKGYLNKAKAYSQRTAGATYRMGAATVGAVGRQTVGRRNKTELVRLQNDKAFQETLKKEGAEGRAARMKLAKIQERAASTYDVRNTRVGGAVGSAAKMAGVDTGTGSKHNRIDDDATDKKDKKTIEDAKKLFPGNEEAQARYIKERMGGVQGEDKKNLEEMAKNMFPGDKEKQDAFIKERTASRLDNVAYKDTKESAEAALKKADRKRELDAQVKLEKAETDKLEAEHAARIKNIEAEKTAGRLTPEEVEEKKRESEAVMESEVAKVVQTYAEKMKPITEKMNARDAADIAGKYSDSGAFAASLNRAQHAAIQTKQGSDKPYEDYKDEGGNVHSFSMKNLNENAMAHNEDLRGTLAAQAKLKTGAYAINLEEQLGKRVDRYDHELRELNKLADGEDKRRKIEDLKTRHDSAVQDIMGAMTPKEVARMKDEIKKHDTVVANYTTKHYDEIINYHKNVRADFEKESGKALLDEIRSKAEKTPSGKKYMGTDNGKAYRRAPTGGAPDDRSAAMSDTTDSSILDHDDEGDDDDAGGTT